MEKRFEQLQTENSRLKADLSDAYNESGKLSTAISRLEESRSSLQWVLEDERNQKIVLEDSMKREMQKLSLDLSIAKEGAAKKVFELENEIDKVRSLINSIVSTCKLTFRFPFVADKHGIVP